MSDHTPEVFLITGPAGAGKTAVAQRWARTRPYQCAQISLDDVRLMVKSGYADPQDGWGADQRRQFEIARGSVALLAGRFVRAGIRCVIDDAIFPDWPYDDPGVDYAGWAQELNGISHRLVVLLPSLDAVLDRNAERKDTDRLNSEMTKTIYRKMAPWRDGDDAIVIDNSCLSVEDTVAAVEAALLDNPHEAR